MSRLDDLRRDYNQQYHTTIRVAGEFAAENFRQLGSWRDGDVSQFARFMRQTDGMVFGAAQNLERYYSGVARVNRVENFVRTAVTLDEVRPDALRATVGSAEELWRRPFATMHTALSEGKTIKEAIELGATRAEQIAKTNVQLGMGRAGLKSRQANDIKFYRRVLTGMENCGLCVLASTQRYRQNDLKPIHPGCDCGEEPLFGYTEADPLVIDQDTLDQINEYVDGSPLEGVPLGDLRNQIFVFDHGEMGPQLRYAGQNVNRPSVAEVRPNPAPPSGKPYEPVYSEDDPIRVGTTNYRDGVTDEQVEALSTYTASGYQDINAWLRRDFDSMQIDAIDDEKAMELLESRITTLDSLFESARTTKPVTVYRGTNSEMFGYEASVFSDEDMVEFSQFVSRLEDQTIELDGGFFSTTQDAGVAPQFMGTEFAGPDSLVDSAKVFVELKVPEGAPAVDVGSIFWDTEDEKWAPIREQLWAASEREVIIDRRAQARVTAVIPPDQVAKSELVKDRGRPIGGAWYIEMELIVDADE